MQLLGFSRERWCSTHIYSGKTRKRTTKWNEDWTVRRLKQCLLPSNRCFRRFSHHRLCQTYLEVQRHLEVNERIRPRAFDWIDSATVRSLRTKWSTPRGYITRWNDYQMNNHTISLVCHYHQIEWSDDTSFDWHELIEWVHEWCRKSLGIVEYHKRRAQRNQSLVLSLRHMSVQVWVEKHLCESRV